MNNGKPTTTSKVQAVASAAVAEATLTLAFLAKVEKVLATVQYIRTACGLLGIARRTFYHWKREGAALRDQLPLAQLDARQRRLVEFCNAVERGIALGEVRDLEVITHAARSNWRAAAWRLERRAPQRWGARRPSWTQNRAEIKQLVAELLAELAAPPDAERRGRSPAPSAEAVVRQPHDVNKAARATLAAIAVPERLDRALFAAGNGANGRGLDALVNYLGNSVGAALHASRDALAGAS